MAISLQQIDLLRERAHVGYKEAKEALEKCNGEMVEALIYLEGAKKTKEKCSSQFFSKMKKIIRKGNLTRVVIKKQEKNALNIPLNLVIVFTIFATPVVLVVFLLALITKHKIRIEKNDEKDCSVNKVLDKITNKVSKVIDDINTEDSEVKKEC
ncbi:DUF4342 domain-containing protein [Clostridium aestuarii]|uniref:DUF4342 domain-containing protein n=1 Tax=Clostridium aestuarii TaxID=338193 RepID=A0ABT4CV65_9CLOT|nr:DUF4342 domain-containing protein [Clostridium aestuarii]MCY6482861.1 DUF4342 domain-containing protein [Clostridium aestuarii]